MAKSLIVFTRFPKSYAPQRLKQEAQKMGLNVSIKSYKYTNPIQIISSDFAIFRNPGNEKKYINTRDILLTKLQKDKTKILNSKTFLDYPLLTKFKQFKLLSKYNIAHVQTEFISKFDPKNLKFPVVAKPNQGSHGDGVYKINNLAEFNNINKLIGDDKYLIQPCLKEGADLRVIVLGGIVLGCIKRQAAKNQFVANFSKGGSVTKFDLDDSQKKLCVNVCKKFNLDFAGIDLIEDHNGEWKVLEINRSCQFEGFELATKINVAQKIINFLTTKNPA